MATRHRHREDLTVDYWPGFTDALLSVVLVLVFVVTIFVMTETGLVQALGSRDTALTSLSKQLTTLEAQLSLSTSRAEKLDAQLALSRKEFDSLSFLYAQEQAWQLALVVEQKPHPR